MRSDSQTLISIRILFPSISFLFVLSTSVLAQGSTMEPRWGHAAAYIPSIPAILIQGGKTDPTGAFTYTSSPNSADTLLIPLDQPFEGSSPPVRQVTSDSAPAYAFHTLSNTAGSGTSYDLLLFGGDGGSSTPTQTQPDSAWTGGLNASDASAVWTHQDDSWGNQPQRRLYHSAAGPGSDGRVYITGGLKGDGSGATFSDVYAYDTSSQTFVQLPPLSQGTYHHNSILLANGTLILLGGVATSPETGNPATIPLSQAMVLDTSSETPSWETRSIGGDGAPSGRRGSSLTLNADGSKAFLFGGADAALQSSLGDGWELDLGSASWKQVTAQGNGPTPRYGHIAVNVGGDQVVMFGGYGDSGPAEADIHIFDAITGTWGATSTSSPSPTLPIGASSSTASGTETGSPASVGPKGSATVAVSSQPGLSAMQTAGQQSDVSASASGSTPASPGNAAGSILTTPAKIALILGIVAIVGIAVGGLLYRYRRKKRKAAGIGAALWNGKGGGGDRPYGSREKGGEGLMEESREGPSETVEKSPIIGLGMGVIGASLASISSKLGPRRNQDPYAVLHDEGDVGGPIRRSTRREGNGIRLVGPRPSPSSKYAPVRLGAALGRVRSPLDAVQESRINMLHDEDSRRFFDDGQSPDWIITSPVDKGRWSSARSILGHHQDDSDPFDDDEGDDLSPPIRGGPVPTPHASQSDLDPFEDYNRRSSTFLSTFDDLLSPPVAHYSDGGSLPRSQRSGTSGDLSDMEEGSVHHAHFVSQTPASLVSPIEAAYVPIKRSESFFKRMTQGGITSLLSRQQSQKGTVRVLDIRDPTPAPELWPIESRDELTSPVSAGPSYPPSSFKDGLAPITVHGRGPSLSSIQSAKSMRDMVIVQREATSSSEEEGIIETASSPGSDMPETTGASLTLSDSQSTIYAHARHGQTAVSDSSPSITTSPFLGGQTPGSIVFNGADFAPTPDLSLHAPGEVNSGNFADSDKTPTKNSLPSTSRAVSIDSTTTPPKSISTASQRITARPSAPPSGSPVPSPLLSHRRPVRDFVNSINKRGGGLPLAFASPSSAYSPATTAPPSPLSRRDTERDKDGRKRPMTMYEAVKRERLLVANPDKRKEMHRTNSS